MTTFLDAISVHAMRRPSATALVICDAMGSEHFAWTYRQLHDACTRAASQLWRIPGVSATQTVAVIASPHPTTIATLIGAVACGLRVDAIHPSTASIEIAARMRAVGTSVLLSPSECHEGFALAMATGDHSVKSTIFPSKDDGSIVLNSSGTTGQPALAIRTATSLLAVARNVREGLGLDVQDRVVLAVPVCHSYGIDLTWGVLETGATLVWVPHVTSQSLTRVVTENATVLPGVPFQFDLLARADVRSHSLRLAVSAGSIFPNACGVQCATDGASTLASCMVRQSWGLLPCATEEMTTQKHISPMLDPVSRASACES